MQASQAAQPSGNLVAGRINPLHRLFTIATPVSFIGLLLLLKIFAGETYTMLVQEDGIFEYLTFFVYATATGYAVATSWILRRKGELFFSVLYLALALGLLLIGGEEISWGQRIFHVQSPEFFQEHNVQQETNIHNFLSRRKLHAAFIVFSSAAAFAWLFLPMVLRYFPERLRTFLSERTWLMAPDRRLMLYFLPTTLLYIYLERDYINWDVVKATLASRFGAGLSNPFGELIVHRDQEPIELLLGAGMMMFTLTVFALVRKLPERKAHG